MAVPVRSFAAPSADVGFDREPCTRVCFRSPAHDMPAPIQENDA